MFSKIGLSGGYFCLEVFSSKDRGRVPDTITVIMNAQYTAVLHEKYYTACLFTM